MRARDAKGVWRPVDAASVDAAATAPLSDAERLCEVRECVRNLADEVKLRCELGPSYCEPLECYRRRPGAKGCKFGSTCTVLSGWHWLHFDHAPEHPVLVAPPEERAALRPWTLSAVPVCRHFVSHGRCQYGDACSFAHPPQRSGRPAEGGGGGPAAFEVALPWEGGPAAASAAAQPSARRRQQRKERSGYKATAAFRRFLIDTFVSVHVQSHHRICFPGTSLSGIVRGPAGSGAARPGRWRGGRGRCDFLLNFNVLRPFCD